MKRKPEWIKTRLYSVREGMKVTNLLKSLNLNTVCAAAKCPNIGECYSRKTATFMILGDVCSRNCRFCNVSEGSTQKVDINEPKNIASAVSKLELKHVVITSVTRDDLPDGGASHFKNVIEAIRDENIEVTIEVLIPDFKGDIDALKTVITAKPDIINHNLETIERLYDDVRQMASYKQSLELLDNVKKYSEGIFTKSGIMVGLSEKQEEVNKLMDDLREVDCDFITIGQYLMPSKDHYPLYEYVEPKIFDEYKETAYQKGFKHVASGPLVRSSYFADQVYDQPEELKL